MISADAQSPVRNVVILGAGGYVGRSFCRFFHSLPDYSVTAFFHREPDHRFFNDHLVVDVFADEWARKISPAPFALINCAFEFAAVDRTDYEAKYAAFDRNLATLREHRAVRLLNVSTMSAYPDCLARYGRDKLFVEQLFSKHNGVNLRSGLVASWRTPGAAMLRLIDVTRNSKFVPLLVARDSGFFFCDLEALVLGAFLVMTIYLNKPHTLSFCYRERLSLGKVMDMIERRYDIRRVKVPVPWLAAYLLLVVKESIFGKSKIRADSVIDFAYPAKVAYQRDAFACMIRCFRSELEALAGTERIPRGFYFLEGKSVEGARKVPHRLKEVVGRAPIEALGRLADS